jgi:hypothetical protein
MLCNCHVSPCNCTPSTAAPTAGRTTFKTRCDRYTPGSENVWVERGSSPNDVTATGVCMLDSMTDAQIAYSLERDDQARADLLTVTSDPHLLELARTVPKLPKVEVTDAEQALLNQPNNVGSIPFYALFRGQPPFPQ